MSCEEIINEEDITDNVVELLAPANNVTMATSDVNFNWQTVYGATGYRLQVATPAFSNATQILLDTTITSANFSQVLSENKYEWRVRALNLGYETGYTTNAFEVVEEL